MIKHYILFGHQDLPSLSPFCTKTDLYLRMRGLEFRNINGDPRKAPMGKLPFIDDGGQKIADSQLIVDHLEKTRPEPLDAGLSAESSARGHAIRRMLEEGLYFAAVYARWADDRYWPEFKKTISAKMPIPGPLKPIIMPKIRKGVLKSLLSQGTGRHEPDQVYAFAERDLDALVTLLGEGPYLLGDTPRSVDAVAFGFLAQGVMCDIPSRLADIIKSKPALVAYVERLKDAYYSK
jgi:glutathione S-transferase